MTVGVAFLVACTSVGAADARADAQTPAPRSIGVPAACTSQNQIVGPVVADGRSALTFTTNLAPFGKHAAPPPLVATCVDSAAVYHDTIRTFSLIPAAVSEERLLSCRAQIQKATCLFRLRVLPPPPGIYASVAPADLVAGEVRAVKIRAFEIPTPGTARSLREVTVSASTGAVTASDDQGLVLDVGEDRAPRIIALALTDGTRFGAAFVTVRGRTNVPVEAEADASIRVKMGGTSFGPFETTKGKVSAPITVPPGAREAELYALDALGNERRVSVDLSPPLRSRLAIVPMSGKVAPRGQLLLGIAYVGENFLPATHPIQTVTSSHRGAIDLPRQLGAGLYTLSYRAPAPPGVDEISLRIADDAQAGEETIHLRIEAPLPAQVEVVLESLEYVVGTPVEGRIVVNDASGNRLHHEDIQAQIDGRRIDLIPEHGGSRFSTLLPEKVPEGGESLISAAAGPARAQVTLKVRAGPPEAAEIDADIVGRSAAIRVAVADVFGNPVTGPGLRLVAAGGTISPPRRTRGATTALLEPEPDADTVRIAALWGEELLAQRQIVFPTPRHPWALGLRATGGLHSNSALLHGPRVGLSTGLRRELMGIEMALLLGAEYSRSEASRDVGGIPVSLVTQTLGFPVEIRARYEFQALVGVVLGLGIAPTAIRVVSTTQAQPPERDNEVRVAMRGIAGADMHLGPGRALVSMSVGHGSFAARPLTGPFERFAILVGYEWWFLSF